jgi:hypothetical protein
MDNGVGGDNEELGSVVAVCRGPDRRLGHDLTQLQHYS